MQETGIPVFTVAEPVELGFVNLANGNLHIEIPLTTTPQRGNGKFTPSLIYDSRMWGIVTPQGSQQQWNLVGGGWQYRATDSGFVNSTYTTLTYTCSGTNYTVSQYSNFIFTATDGTRKIFFLTTSSDPSPCKQYNYPTASGYASDNSGYFMSVTNAYNAEVFAPDGTIVSIPNYTGVVTYQDLTDTNGNYYQWADANYLSMIDSSGRTPVLVTRNGNYITYYDVLASDGSRSRFTVTTADFPAHTAFASGPLEFSSTVRLIQTVQLPNNTSYSFQYDSGTTSGNYAELTKTTLPNGSTVQYNWTTFADASGSGENRWASGRTTPDGTWTYTMSFAGGTSCIFSSSGCQQTRVVVSRPDGNQQAYTFLIFGDAMVSEVDYYSGSTSGTLLKKVALDYDMNRRPIRYTTTLPSGSTNLVSKFEYTYTPTGTNRLIQWIKEWDYGSGTFGSLLRQTYISYLSTTPYTTRNIINRPLSKVIYNGSGTIIAQTQFGYDESQPISTGGSAPGHDYTHYSYSFLNRGNTTSRKDWKNTDGTWLTTTYAYDDLGNLRSVTDPAANTTSFSYADNFTDGTNRNAQAYVTQAAYPTTNGVPHVERKQYYWPTGRPATSCGQNFPAASVCANTYSPPQSDYTTSTYDWQNRPLIVVYGDGGQTTYSYNDTAPPFSSTQTKLLSGSTNLTSKTISDWLGRVSQVQLNSDPDCASGDKTDTTHDTLGRVHTISNPYCTTSDPTYGLTTYAYDALDRTTQITRPDNSSTVLTTYAGRATQVQDEGNGTRRVTRISQVDGLGRLVSVCEVTSASQLGSGGSPAACGQDIAATGFLTTYSYDTLDNLTSVSQSGLNSRSFQYDSLSRLTSASNPESGAIAYKYDADTNCASPNSFTGLLVSKTDARSIRTCMQYDALNRMTQKNYSDSTPTAFFAYEQTSSWGVTLTNTVGRLTEQWTGTSCCATAGAEIFSYDQMGRPLLNEQFTPAMGYVPVNYTYDLAGNMTSFTNGGGETFSYTVNGAARLTTLTSSLVDSNHPGTLFSGAHYNAAGAMLSVSIGNVITETRTYDPRLRLASISDGSNYSLTIPSSGGYAPNSDILAANDSVNGNWTYLYDDFNRLSGSNQNSGQAVYSYVYDRFGNRWQQNGPHSMQLSFSGANNRLDGYSYDAAGNLLSDGSHQYFYDAESRLIQVDGTLGTCSTATACYGYDASGRRVQKTTSSGTASYIYDLAGHEVVQYGPTCSPCRDEIYAGGRHFATYANSTTYFIHNDWLGTERARSSVSGAPYETCTSLPFGDWLTCTGGDPSPLHFTGKERDSETGLDNFGARFDSSSFGRFLSPDPDGAGSLEQDPQSWNMYAYTRNNPLRYTDPDGRDYYVCINNYQGGQNCTKIGNDAVFLQQVKDSPGVSLQGDPSQSGNIVANGQVVGTFQHFIGPGNEGTSEDTILAPVIGLGLYGGIRAGIRGIVGGLFGGGAKAVAEETVAAAAEQIVSGGTKQAVREAVENSGLSNAAKAAVKSALRRGAAADKWTVEKLADGTIKVTREVAGAAGGKAGAVYEQVIDGATGLTKSAVQTGTNAAGEVIHVDPKFP